jgi:hypothetical protein
MQRLMAVVRARGEVGETEVSAMYTLFAQYYDAATPAAFRADLAEKSFVIELREGKTLRGFSTLVLVEFEYGGVARRAIFSGDTIIDHRYWGEQTLAVAFCRFAGMVHATAPSTPLYWLLISKGYRTFRYLAVFARHYYPNPLASTPAEEQECLDQLARERFGDAYAPERGVLHYQQSRGHLRQEWAGVRDGVSTRPDVKFFLERNPGYRLGDELVCIARLHPDNLKSFARRAFVKGMTSGESIEHAGFL